MPFPVPITDHVERVLAGLGWKITSDPQLARLATIVGEEIQELEDWIWDLITGIRLDNAVGVHLDRWGRLVGELRGEFTDNDEFRRVIRARAIANRSKYGPTETIIAITRLLTEADAGTIRVIQQGRAHFRLIYEVATPLPQRLRDALVRILFRAVSVGVSFTVVEANSGDDIFTYDAPPGAGYDEGHYSTKIA